jgi:hypothetical protein
MAHLQVTTPGTDKLKDLFASDEGMAALAEQVLNQVLDAQPGNIESVWHRFSINDQHSKVRGYTYD